ncbi:MAG: Rieske 2Fe-2S domain-containing protein [Janthinobacterium lividum]
MFLLNTWYVAAMASEITADSLLARTICDERIVLFRDAAGAVSALEDRCSHRGLPLSCGKKVGGNVECGYHGLIFGATGQCLKVPGQDLVPVNASVRRYAVVERDQLIWIWMGSLEAAVPDRIPDLGYHNEPGVWAHRGGVLPLKCNYMLIVDNLMDLSHIGYVHGSIVNVDPSDHSNAETTVNRAADNVTVTRLMRNVTSPDVYLRAVKFKGKIDRWQQCVLHAPSNILQETRGSDVGTGVDAAVPPPGGVRLRVFHGLTPETEKSSFYFWTAAHAHRPDDPAVTEQLYKDIDATIREDVEVLEKQQSTLDRYPDRNYVDIESDKPRLQGRRFVERLIMAEQSVPAEMR